MANIRIFASLWARSVERTLVFQPKYLQNNVCLTPLCSVYDRNRRFCSSGAKPEPATAKITFIDRDGDKKTVSAKYGESLLDTAKNNDIDLEGACEGTLSCSTCHLIFGQEEYDKIDAVDPPSDEELDMLDLAYGLTPTSRLGCQIEVTEKLDGTTLKVPEATRDVRDT